jgi:hypothetical protein
MSSFPGAYLLVLSGLLAITLPNNLAILFLFKKMKTAPES